MPEGNDANCNMDEDKTHYNIKYKKYLTVITPVRKSETAKESIKRLEMVLSRLSIIIAQNTKPLPMIDRTEQLPNSIWKMVDIL